jgi:DNA polymerase-3 subunit epsilon
MYLFYDCETTGLPDFSAPAEHFQKHPGIAQLAAVLLDKNRKVHGSMNFIIAQPDHVPFSEQAAAIHGITKERMQTVGVTPALAVASFLELLEKAECVVAHNRRFDEKMLRIELHRAGNAAAAEALRQKAARCTMIEADEIMKMAPTERMMAAGFTKSKPPKLTEAYEYFMKKPMTGAHDASHDVRATIDIFFAIENHKAAAAA